MARAAVLTRWIGDGLSPQTANRPALFNGDVAQLPGETCVDVTLQQRAQLPPSPNVVIVEVNCSDATLAAIKAHAQYGAMSVLWEGDPTQSPVVTEPQYDAFANWLLNKAQNNRFPNATINHIYTALGGANSNGRTRYEIAQTLIAWLRQRPKG